jgi:class 3 adenylate cyclase
MHPATLLANSAVALKVFAPEGEVDAPAERRLGFLAPYDCLSGGRMMGLPTGTVTFLFTDIEGSTTLLQHLGDRRYAEVLAEHQRVLRDAFAEGHGQKIDTQGDAFLVAFSRARDAVATAVAAQRPLMKHAWPDAASLRVRMALHTGEPAAKQEGMFA